MLRMLVLKPSGIIPMHCNTLQRTATHCNRMQHMLRMLVSTPSDSILYQTFCREWRALSREYRAILGEYWARLKECRALSHIFSLHDSFGRVQGAFFYILFSTNPTFCFKRILHSVSNEPYILFQTNPTFCFKQTLHSVSNEPYMLFQTNPTQECKALLRKYRALWRAIILCQALWREFRSLLREWRAVLKVLWALLGKYRALSRKYRALWRAFNLC